MPSKAQIRAVMDNQERRRKQDLQEHVTGILDSTHTPSVNRGVSYSFAEIAKIFNRQGITISRQAVVEHHNRALAKLKKLLTEEEVLELLQPAKDYHLYNQGERPLDRYTYKENFYAKPRTGKRKQSKQPTA